MNFRMLKPGLLSVSLSFAIAACSDNSTGTSELANANNSEGDGASTLANSDASDESSVANTVGSSGSSIDLSEVDCESLTAIPEEIGISTTAGYPEYDESYISSNTQGNDGSSSEPVSGPARYRTGSIAVKSVWENIGTGETISVNLETDTQANVITDNFPFSFTRLPFNDTPDLVYDESGRVTKMSSYGGTGGTSDNNVYYNDDGSVDSIFHGWGDEVSTEKFFYVSGRLVCRARVHLQGRPRVIFRMDYNYDDNGQLVRSTQFTPWTNEIIPGGGDEFEMNAAGRITEVRENVAASGTFEKRNVLSYDDMGNIIRHEIFSKSGTLESVITTTYESSSELVPNVLGFLSAVNVDFLPLYDVLGKRPF